MRATGGGGRINVRATRMSAVVRPDDLPFLHRIWNLADGRGTAEDVDVIRERTQLRRGRSVSLGHHAHQLATGGFFDFRADPANRIEIVLALRLILGVDERTVKPPLLLNHPQEPFVGSAAEIHHFLSHAGPKRPLEGRPLDIIIVAPRWRLDVGLVVIPPFHQRDAVVVGHLEERIPDPHHVLEFRVVPPPPPGDLLGLHADPVREVVHGRKREVPDRQLDVQRLAARLNRRRVHAWRRLFRHKEVRPHDFIRPGLDIERRAVFFRIERHQLLRKLARPLVLLVCVGKLLDIRRPVLGAILRDDLAQQVMLAEKIGWSQRLAVLSLERERRKVHVFQWPREDDLKGDELVARRIEIHLLLPRIPDLARSRSLFRPRNFLRRPGDPDLRLRARRHARQQPRNAQSDAWINDRNSSLHHASFVSNPICSQGYSLLATVFGSGAT